MEKVPEKPIIYSQLEKNMTSDEEISTDELVSSKYVRDARKKQRRFQYFCCLSGKKKQYCDI